MLLKKKKKKITTAPAVIVKDPPIDISNLKISCKKAGFVMPPPGPEHTDLIISETKNAVSKCVPTVISDISEAEKAYYRILPEKSFKVNAKKGAKIMTQGHNPMTAMAMMTSQFDLLSRLFDAVEQIKIAAAENDPNNLATQLIHQAKLVDPELRSLADNVALRLSKISGGLYGGVARDLARGYEYIYNLPTVNEALRMNDVYTSAIQEMQIQMPKMKKEVEKMQKLAARTSPKVKQAFQNLQQAGDELQKASEEAELFTKLKFHRGAVCPGCIIGDDTSVEREVGLAKDKLQTAEQNYDDVERDYHNIVKAAMETQRGLVGDAKSMLLSYDHLLNNAAIHYFKTVRMLSSILTKAFDAYATKLLNCDSTQSILVPADADKLIKTPNNTEISVFGK